MQFENAIPARRKDYWVPACSWFLPGLGRRNMTSPSASLAESRVNRLLCSLMRGSNDCYSTTNTLASKKSKALAPTCETA